MHILINYKSAKMSKSTPSLALMHDTAHDISIIESLAHLIDKSINPETIDSYTKLIRQSCVDLRAKLDAYYLETKEKTTL